jgi:HSP20 family molecular chaperone IbpA
MPSAKPALTAKRALTPRLVDEIEGQKIAQALHKGISERAYRLYLESGRQDGNDEKNWMQAKSEMLQILETRGSGTWVYLTASIADFSPENIEVYVDAHRVLVKLDRAASAAASEGPVREASSSFLAADLDVELDPATATAAVKDRTLNLMVKKRSAANTTRRRGS